MARKLREAGAVLPGKSNLREWANFGTGMTMSAAADIARSQSPAQQANGGGGPECQAPRAVRLLGAQRLGLEHVQYLVPLGPLDRQDPELSQGTQLPVQRLACRPDHLRKLALVERDPYAFAGFHSDTPRQPGEHGPDLVFGTRASHGFDLCPRVVAAVSQRLEKRPASGWVVQEELESLVRQHEKSGRLKGVGVERRSHAIEQSCLAEKFPGTQYRQNSLSPIGRQSGQENLSLLHKVEATQPLTLAADKFISLDALDPKTEARQLVCERAMSQHAAVGLHPHRRNALGCALRQC